MARVNFPRSRPIVRETPQGRKKANQEIVEDHGVTDKRLLVVETEFAKVLKAMARDPNTLSEAIRQCWDTGDLGTMSKNNGNRATGAHVSIIAHFTRADIQKNLCQADTLNGFANRFFWVLCRRLKHISNPDQMELTDWAPIRDELADIADWAKRQSDVRMVRDAQAERLWDELYPSLSDDKPGIAGSVLGRAVPEVMRIACLYATLDKSDKVGLDHLRAARRFGITASLPSPTFSAKARVTGMPTRSSRHSRRRPRA